MPQEFAELPVRHNEDVLNGELSKKLPWAVGNEELDSPHVKAHLLLQVNPYCARGWGPTQGLFTFSDDAVDVM